MPVHPLISKFGRVLDLTDADLRALQAVPVRQATIGPDQDVVRRGDRPTRSLIVVDGLLATSKTSTTGTRQIMALHVAEDMPDLMTLYLDVMDSDLRTISSSNVAFIEHFALRALCKARPTIAAALWRATLVDAAVLREWVINVGQRQALPRVAHVFCEMMARMDAVGLTENGGCILHLTQSNLGEVTGLSNVHVNRTIQTLRERRLISFKGHKLTIYDRDALYQLGDFDPEYLHVGMQ